MVYIKSDGQDIYTRTWEHKEPLKATIVFFHGIGEHISRYDHMFNIFAERGIKVHSFDQRGFGKTVRMGGIHGHNEGFDQVLRDGKAASDRVKQPSVPHFVMGHSMGGGIALRFALEFAEELNGCIASAPMIVAGASTSIPEWQYKALTYISKVLSNVPVPNPINSEGICRDEKVRQLYEEDPFVHFYCSPRTAVDVIGNGIYLLDEGHKKFNIPLLISHGTEDLLTSYEASKEFFEKVNVEDKEFLSFDGFYHELHNEPEKKKVIQGYIDWILKRC